MFRTIKRLWAEMRSATITRGHEIERLKRQVADYRVATRNDANEIQRLQRYIETQDETIAAQSLRLTELEAIHSALVPGEVVVAKADTVDVGEQLPVPAEQPAPPALDRANHGAVIPQV